MSSPHQDQASCEGQTMETEMHTDVKLELDIAGEPLYMHQACGEFLHDTVNNYSYQG